MSLRTTDRAPGDIHDLGFGARYIRDSALRLLNRDGTFNVSRGGLPLFKSLNLYQTLLGIPWWKFNLVFIVIYFLVNLVFAVLYFLCGPQALAGTEGMGSRAFARESNKAVARV